jgi:hypothetical protein
MSFVFKKRLCLRLFCAVAVFIVILTTYFLANFSSRIIYQNTLTAPSFDIPSQQRVAPQQPTTILTNLSIGVSDHAIAGESSCSFARNQIPPDDPNLEAIRGQRMNLAEPHYFVFPEKDDRSIQYMCVPQKNGNQQVAGLFYALYNDGRVLHRGSKTGEALIGALKKRKAHRRGLISRKDGGEQQVFIVTRNPYTRILSFWMDKIQRKSPDENFTGFVELLEADIKAGKGLCGINHHLCSQTTLCLLPALTKRKAMPPMLFKIRLEDQAAWFPCLLQVTKSNMSLLHGEQFVSFSGTPCFYTPTGDCSDMTRIVPPNDPALQKDLVGRRHPTGASRSENMNQYHNAYTASIVTELYREDFEFFDYPLWDGIAPWGA